MEISTNSRIIMVATVLGALFGLGAGFLLVRRYEEAEGELTFDAGKGLRAALLALTMMRGINELAAPE
jgi:hypothetical protein